MKVTIKKISFLKNWCNFNLSSLIACAFLVMIFIFQPRERRALAEVISGKVATGELPAGLAINAVTNNLYCQSGEQYCNRD